MTPSASAEQHADCFCDEYPPIATTLSTLDGDEREALRRDIVALAEEFDVSDGDGLVLPLDYLEVVARRS